MKYLKKFESNVFEGYLKMREDILDLCTDLKDNDIRFEVLPAGGETVELEISLDLELSQWHRGFHDVALADGDYSDSIKFLDVYREKLCFILSELSTISKRLERSGYKANQLTGGSSSRNEFFKMRIRKDTDDLLKTASRRRS